MGVRALQMRVKGLGLDLTLLSAPGKSFYPSKAENSIYFRPKTIFCAHEEVFKPVMVLSLENDLLYKGPFGVHLTPSHNSSTASSSFREDSSLPGS
jgi:hypothetical protein